MHKLRNIPSLTRLVLAWFMLTLGVAVASPIVHPHAMELVCTTSGSMQVITLDEDGNQATSGLHHSLDCPLCLAITTPPVHLCSHLEQPHPLGLALQSVVAARIAALVGAPLPPRGPPSFV